MKTFIININFKIIFILIFLFFVAGCGGSKKSEEKIEAKNTFGSGGGTLELKNINSPINGTKIVIPHEAIDASEKVTISIAYQDSIPGSLNTGVVAASKGIILTKDAVRSFKFPVDVTIPYSDNNLDYGDVPGVFYWDKDYNKYVSVKIKAIDTFNKKITFSTIHFSLFVALAVKGLARSISSIDTGFRSDQDGFYHPNFGSYDSPGGSCLGMANFSGWYYTFAKPNNNSGLYFRYKQDDQFRWEDDTNARELISRAFMSSSQIWANLWMLTDYLLGDSKTGLLLLTTMIITKSPQTFLFRGQNFAHAVTVYKYDFELEKFYLYDNNFPGEEVTLDWNTTNGFSNYSKEYAYPKIYKFGFEAFSSAFESKTFETLLYGAENGWSSSKFQTINITNPELNRRNQAIIPFSGEITITGYVSGGTKNASFLVYNLNGNGNFGGKLIRLDSNGGFSFKIIPNNYTKNTLLLMSTDDSLDAKRRVPNAYSGFKEFELKIQGQNFFNNFGFESGDFNGWEEETHTWQNSFEYSFPSSKNEIVTIETDYVSRYSGSSFLPQVYKGNYSARINNSDKDSHISTVSQTAIVPKVTRPELRFYWAAVLEDPLHQPEYQPYVEVLLQDNYTEEYLYHRRFYANDPSYSGWKTVYGVPFNMKGENGEEITWRIIPWQPVFIDLSERQGHFITLKVTGSDCGHGGHGGYVYLDGDE
ncbi:MAG: hypothetical protein AB1394_08020 [Bacteroidota bacterium]